MAGTIVKYHCNYCEEDITSIRVKCSECQDFDLCLQDCGTFPIFNDNSSPDKWKAYEEIGLLDAIEQYGLGNWSDIVEKLGRFEVDQVKDHYVNYYVLGNVGKTSWSGVENKTFSMKDHTCPKDGPLSPSLTTPLPAITEVSQQEQHLLGYMPKRDDFEREFDNEAESLVSTLSVGPSDEDDLEAALKLAYINMYQRRLMERFRRKHIAREFGLVNLFFKSQNNTQEQSQVSTTKTASNGSTKKKNASSSSNSFRDELTSIYDEKYKPFCQFQSWDEHQEFFQHLQRERELKSRIKELMRYRRNGLKRFTECSSFESARCKREKRKENKKKPISSTGSVHKKSFGTATRGSSKEKELNNSSSPVTKRGAGDASDTSRKSDKEEFDVTSLPGCRLLSEREKKLCTSVRLRPTQYVTLKTLILKDHAQRVRGLHSKSGLENIDKSLRRKIVNFMVKSGWMSAS